MQIMTKFCGFMTSSMGLCGVWIPDYVKGTRCKRHRDCIQLEVRQTQPRYSGDSKHQSDVGGFQRSSHA